MGIIKRVQIQIKTTIITKRYKKEKLFFRPKEWKKVPYFLNDSVLDFCFRAHYNKIPNREEYQKVSQG